MAAESAITSWGTIEVEPLGSNQITGRTVGSPTLEVDFHKYEWRPSAEIREHLPEDYRVSLNAMSCRGECRRLYPEDPDEFVRNALLGGSAILTRVKHLDAEHRHTYNLMRLLFQYGPLVREALDRTFSRAVDLMVLGTLQQELGCADVLPDSLGRNAAGKGKRWTIHRLIEAGQEEAKARELRRFSSTDIIRLGLHSAARRNPVDIGGLTTEQAAGLLRLSLFDLGPANVPVDEATKAEVLGRLQDALERHLADSDEDFDEWFFQKRDGIVHQISKRKSGPGPIDRAVVREVLLEAVFHSMQYMGQCVNAQMFDFVQAIQPPLSHDDRALFEVLYFAQPWLAGIPLAVVHRYFAPTREAIEDLWLDPRDPEKAGVLLRVLQYHGEMVSKRRQADRAAKQVGARRSLVR